MTSGGMHATTTVRKKDPLAYVLGILAAVPISYPGPPYYLLAFAILAICGFSLFVRLTNSLNSIAICAAAAGILLSAIAIFSSLASPYKDLLGPERIITTSLFYLFFICGLAIVDYERFFRGLVDAIAVQAGFVIIAAVFYFPWHYGALVFSAPPLRLWGADMFPDWPNFYAAMLCMGFIVAIALQGRWIVGLMCLTAAFLTTSRTVFLAVAILLAWHILFRQQRYRFLVIIGIIFIGLGGLIVIFTTGAPDSEFASRLLLISDRLTILWSSMDLILDNLVTGVGGIVLDERVGHLGAASFHNSYLEVAVRMGLIGLVIYLPLIFLPLFLLRWSDGLISLTLFLLAGSMFQNLLRHPHIAIVFSMIIAWAGLKWQLRLSSGRRPEAGTQGLQEK